MTMRIQSQRRSGVTLLELLCVIAIITVIAGLLLGPAARILKKMRADQWSNRASEELRLVVQQLRSQFRGREDFPAVTLERMASENLVGAAQLSFLRDRRVTFAPFAGSDADDKVVICVVLEAGFFDDGGVLTETKGAIANPPE